MSEFKMPTETIDLPSKGLLYPEENPLSAGTVEIKYMTAKEEDILTNQSYIRKGIVVDKLLQSLIITKINYDDLVVGDKNAILVAARVLGYGKDYEFSYNGTKQVVDLSTVETKPFNESLVTKGVNEFAFKLPHSSNEVTFKILTGADERKIEKELEGLKKISKDASPELTTRLKHMITSVNGSRESKDIREFVDNYLLARDSRALRDFIKEVQPDIEMTFVPEGGEQPVGIPIGATFLYPDLD
jgi:hypothetical protein